MRRTDKKIVGIRVLRVAVFLLLALLVCGYLGTRSLIAQAERAHPRLGVRLEVDGVPQHFVEQGSGPSIVFVHGAFGGTQDFVQTIIPVLSTRYRCIAWDRPGHGYSGRPEGVVDPGVQARLLLSLIRRLELDRTLLVGFSYGGAVALAAGLQGPDALRGIVLLNGPSHEWPDPLEMHYELPAIPVLGPLLLETLLTPIGHLFAGRGAERAFSPRAVPPAFASSPISLALRPASYRANAEDIRTLKPFLREQSTRYAELALPLTIVVGEDDLVVSPTIHSPALHAAARHSSMLRIPNAGHQILYTHPEIVIDAIDAALKQTSTR